MIGQVRDILKPLSPFFTPNDAPFLILKRNVVEFVTEMRVITHCKARDPCYEYWGPWTIFKVRKRFRFPVAISPSPFITAFDLFECMGCQNNCSVTGRPLAVDQDQRLKGHPTEYTWILTSRDLFKTSGVNERQLSS